MHKFTLIFKLVFLSLVLLTSCAKKELYRFAPPVSSFNDFQKTKQLALFMDPKADSSAVSAAANAQAKENIAYRAELGTESSRLMTNSNPAHQAGFNFNQELVARQVPLTFNRTSLEKQKKLLRNVADEPTGKKPVHKLARLGFILGLAGVTLHLVGLTILGVGGGYLVLAFFTAIAAVILSFLGRKRIKENPEKYRGKGFALAGVLLGSVQLLFYLIFLIAAIAWAASYA